MAKCFLFGRCGKFKILKALMSAEKIVGPMVKGKKRETTKKWGKYSDQHLKNDKGKDSVFFPYPI